MAKFKTIAKEVDAEQWTTNYQPPYVTPRAGASEMGFVTGADGKRRDCKIGDFIVSEVGGAHPVAEGKFLSRFEPVEEAPQQQPPPADKVPASDQTPVTDQVPAQGDASGEVQS